MLIHVYVKRPSRGSAPGADRRLLGERSRRPAPAPRGTISDNIGINVDSTGTVADGIRPLIAAADIGRCIPLIGTYPVLTYLYLLTCRTSR